MHSKQIKQSLKKSSLVGKAQKTGKAIEMLILYIRLLCGVLSFVEVKQA